jgi:hypothetical protein
MSKIMSLAGMKADLTKLADAISYEIGIYNAILSELAMPLITLRTNRVLLEQKVQTLYQNLGLVNTLKTQATYVKDDETKLAVLRQRLAEFEPLRRSLWMTYNGGTLRCPKRVQP